MSRLLKLLDLFAAAFWEPVRHEFAGIAYPAPRPTPRPEPAPVPHPRPQTPPTPIAPPPAVADTLPAEVLFTRRGAGKGTRYDVAHPDATGPRFRKLVKNGRTKFVPAN